MRVFALAVLVAGTVGGAGAQFERERPITVTVDDRAVRFQDVWPQTVDGRVLIPLRGVLEMMDAEVRWEPIARIVRVRRGESSLSLRVGEHVATVAGRQVELDVPALIVDGRTLVPLRFVSEALGAAVTWDAQARHVRIATASVLRAPERPVQVVDDVRIEGVEVTAADHLRAGDTLEVVLRGTPGGVAEFQVPGVTERIEMRETSTGVYTGRWITPKDEVPMTVELAAVVGWLRIGEVVRTIQSRRRVGVDTLAPRLRQLMPAPEAVVLDGRPRIYASFDAGAGTEVDPATVRLYFGGREVPTEEALITAQFLSWRTREAVPPGIHRIRIQGRDRAGNSFEEEWSFRVYSGSAPPRAVVQEAAPDGLLRFVLRAPSGSVAELSVGDLAPTLPMRELTVGRYVAEVRVPSGLAYSRFPVFALVSDATGEPLMIQSEEDLVLEATALAAPRILWPRSESRARGPIGVRGTAEPGSLVEVDIEFRTGEFSGRLRRWVVRTGASGDWETSEVPVRLHLETGDEVEYVVTARTIRGDRRSDPVTARVLG
jgi:hypothetical protein